MFEFVVFGLLLTWWVLAIAIVLGLLLVYSSWVVLVCLGCFSVLVVLLIVLV